MKARKSADKRKRITGTDGGLTESGPQCNVRYADRDTLGVEVEALRAKVKTDCLRSVYVEVSESIAHSTPVVLSKHVHVSSVLHVAPNSKSFGCHCSSYPELKTRPRQLNKR